MLCLVFCVSGASPLATVGSLGEAPETLNTKHQTPIMPKPQPLRERLFNNGNKSRSFAATKTNEMHIIY